MTLRVGLLLTGSELLDGRVLDTNSQWCISLLTEEGHEVRHTFSCGDEIDVIREAVDLLAKRVDAIIVSGGLGPTSDDVTRDALAAWAGVDLIPDAGAEAHVRGFFVRRKRAMSPTNERQWFFPRGSEIIVNPVGTAYGFALSHKGVLVASVPGVPVEYKAMVPGVMELLRRLPAASSRPVRRIVSTCLLPESEIAARVESLSLPSSVTVSYRAAFPEVHVGVTVAASETSPTEVAEKSIKQIVDVIGDEFILARAERLLPPLEEIVVKLLIDRKETVSVAESCTGGMIASLLTSMGGSSAAFLGGVVAYSNAVKSEALSVPQSTIELHGAVSEPTAAAMASGTRSLCRSTYGVSVTGVAGPSGGSEEKPVGTFIVGIASSHGVKTYPTFYPGNRDRIRKFATYRALDLLRRTVLGLPAK